MSRKGWRIMYQASINFNGCDITPVDKLYWSAELAKVLALQRCLAVDYKQQDSILQRLSDADDAAAYDKVYAESIDKIVLDIRYNDVAVKLPLFYDETLYDSFMKFLGDYAAEMSDRIKPSDCQD